MLVGAYIIYRHIFNVPTKLRKSKVGGGGGAASPFGYANVQDMLNKFCMFIGLRSKCFCYIPTHFQDGVLSKNDTFWKLLLHFHLGRDIFPISNEI